MNDIIKNMEERRSIRKYTPEMPKKEDIDQIIEAGLYAATGKNKQDVIIIKVTNKEVRDRLSAANGKIAGAPEGFDPFYGAPVVLIVLADVSWPTHVYDGSLAIGNMMNAARSLGLGTCWIHRAKEEFEMDEYKALLKELGIEGEWEGVGHCIIGYPDGGFPEAAPRNPGRVYCIE